jgi:putative ABC transport system permease protein
VIPSWALVPAMEAVNLKLIMPLWLHISVFTGTVVMCLLAAIVSFRKVASIDPAMVFRT